MAQSSKKQKEFSIQQFQNSQKSVNKAIKKDKLENIARDLKDNKNPWHIAEELLGKKEYESIELVEEGNKILDDGQNAELMSEFFEEKIKKLKTPT